MASPPQERSDTKEIWKDIKGYEGLYQVSNLGRFKSLPRTTTKGGILKIYINSRNKYGYVCLCKENIKKSLRTHRIVLETFSPVKDMDQLQVNHINGIKTDNRLINLEWVTQSENMKHAFDNGLQTVTWNRPVIRLKDNKIYDSLTECAIDNGGSRAYQITRVCNGERKRFRKLRFMYLEDYERSTANGNKQ